MVELTLFRQGKQVINHGIIMPCEYCRYLVLVTTCYASLGFPAAGQSQPQHWTSWEIGVGSQNHSPAA